MNVTGDQLIAGSEAGSEDPASTVKVFVDNLDSFDAMYVERPLNHPRLSDVFACNGVYVISHLKTAKAYIGSSRDVRRRLWFHCSTLVAGKNKNRLLQDLFKECGYSGFVVRIITCQDREHAFDVEQSLLNKYRSQGRLLNLTDSARDNTGVRLTVEHRSQLSARASLRKHSEETKAKLSILRREEGLTESWRENIQNANSKKWQDPDFRKKWEAARLRSVTVDGHEYKSLSEAANAHGISVSSVVRRAKNEAFPTWTFKTNIER